MKIKFEDKGFFRTKYCALSAQHRSAQKESLRGWRRRRRTAHPDKFYYKLEQVARWSPCSTCIAKRDSSSAGCSLFTRETHQSTFISTTIATMTLGIFIIPNEDDLRPW
ncbi:unnamed protein product [Nesidiocoris tenuis]|uniref:Uncharacterized protein n=1 Tax=Nesidiocoris tenuis TaxID=355587 RepID=A0A6H5G474_9HEMI|nr:unnamed protein product [Nesidiocoris tenuis]